MYLTKKCAFKGKALRESDHSSTKVTLPLGSSFERSAGSIPVRCTRKGIDTKVSVLFLLTGIFF